MKNERIRLSLLCDIYGSLLSEKQRNALDLYCNEDLSLSEIAEELGISRQGVRELIKKAENELCFYEEKLGLAKKFRDTESRIRHLISLAEDNRPVEEIKAELLLMEEELEK